LSLASLFSLALCLWIKQGAYPRVEHLKVLYLVSSSLTRKH
jgi:hypothetical protein